MLTVYFGLIWICLDSGYLTGSVTATSQTNLFLKDSVQCSVLVNVKRLFVPQIFDVDGFSWIEAESFSQLLHLIIQKIDLLCTAVDGPCVLLELPDKRIRLASISLFCDQFHYQHFLQK